MTQGLTLSACHISKKYPGVQALDDVSITIHAGALTAILGENGAGKSTLMKILAGEVQPDQGELRFDEVVQRFDSPRAAQSAGIVFVHQELNLIENLSIAENLFLGREPRNRLGFIDFPKLFEQTQSVLDRLQLPLTPWTKISSLRVGQKQLIEIGKAIASRARWIIMDEPTSAITNQEVEILFRLIAEMKSQGIGIVYITHKMDELPSIADHVVIMRDGKLISDGRFQDYTLDGMIRLMVGRDPSEMVARSAKQATHAVLRVESISLLHPERPNVRLVDEVSFSVQPGEVLGIFGLMGAGRTELLESIAGLHPRRTLGQVFVNEQHVVMRSPRDAINAGIVLAPEDRKRDGLVLGMSVLDNLNLANLDSFQSYGLLSRSAQTSSAHAMVERLRIKTPTLTQPAKLLSGGNQQKIVLAKWLSIGPKVFLLDEPTRGIDIHAKSEIYNLLSRFASEGLAIVVVSSEMPELLGMCDRILVMSEGRIAAEFDRSEASEEVLLREALPKSPMTK